MSDMTLTEALQLVQSAYKAGYKRCMQENGKIKPYMSLKQAYNAYGRTTVDRWISEKLITVIKDGQGTCRCRISREQIELVAETSNRCSWFSNNAVQE